MIEAGLAVFNQIIKMVIMMMVGYILYKKKLINDDTIVKLSNILLMVVAPCTIITAFNQPFSTEKLYDLILSFALSFLVYFITILIVQFFYSKEKRIEKFAVVFSNTGFFGIPLVSGLLGQKAVFYLSPLIVTFYIFIWTYGILTMSGRKDTVTVKKIMTNPCIWAMVIGILIFVVATTPYAPVMEAIDMMGSMNTPLAMIVLGAYMAKVKLIEIFNSAKLYLISFYRLILFPILYILLFSMIPVSAEAKSAILIGAAAPSATLTPIFAQMFDKDTGYGVKIVSLSTLLSLISLPIILMIAKLFW